MGFAVFLGNYIENRDYYNIEIEHYDVGCRSELPNDLITFFIQEHYFDSMVYIRDGVKALYKNHRDKELVIEEAKRKQEREAHEESIKRSRRTQWEILSKEFGDKPLNKAEAQRRINELVGQLANLKE